MRNSIKVGITHGDLNGIGYEVIVKALADERFTELCTPVIFGIQKVLNNARRQFGGQEFSFKSVRSAADAPEGVVSLVDIGMDVALQPGQETPEGGEAAIKALRMGVAALKKGEIDVLVTAPISKHNTYSEDFPFAGHTDFLQSELGEENADKALMILADDRMRMALATTHLPVAEISSAITKEKLLQTFETLTKTMIQDFTIERPHIAVFSLNPHNGDNGLLGNEEKDVIIPAIEEAAEKGMLVFGPYSADGFFAAGRGRDFDAIVAMYHDQGLAPFKALSGDTGVNFTAGLPYVRTSPDHGTAFDIAWKGEANPESMRAAIFAAIDIFRRRRAYKEYSANPLRNQFVEKGADKTVDLTKDEEIK